MYKMCTSSHKCGPCLYGERKEEREKEVIYQIPIVVYQIPIVIYQILNVDLDILSAFSFLSS